MAPHSSPRTPSIPHTQPKRNVFGISSSNRRQSNGNFSSGITGSPSLAVASSPQQPTTPAGSGIPSFRALRSFLPFGPSKNASPSSFSSPNLPATPRASFGFGTVRRSMTKERERKMSLNEATMPAVLSIERSKSDSQVDDTNIRRSVSLSQLDEPLLMDSRSSDSAPILRTPSPGIPLSLELSTIMEADSSGVSKHTPIFRTTSSAFLHSRTPSPILLNHDLLQPVARGTVNGTSRRSEPELEADSSMLELSPSELTREVMNAMRASDSPSTSALNWSNTDRAVIIDADGANDSFALEASVLPAVDPSLAALLSPNSIAAKTNRRNASSFLPRLRNPSRSPASSPISARFPTSPVTPTSAASTPKPSPSRSKRSISPAPRSPSSPSVSTSTPAPKRSFIPNPAHLFTPAASSSLSASTGSKFLDIGKGRPSNALRRILVNRSPSSRTDGDANDRPGVPPPMISLSTPPSPSRPTARPRASLDSRRSPIPSNYPEAYRRPSLDVPRPAVEGTGRPSFELRRGTSSRARLPNLFLSRRATPSPEPPSMSSALEASPSPAPDSRFDDEPAFRTASPIARHSLETSRPGSAARMRRDLSLRSGNNTSERPRSGDRLSPAPHPSTTHVIATNRTRKRSMSVQERFNRNRFGNANAHTNEFGVVGPAGSSSTSRPGSSMSMGYGRRGGEGGAESTTQQQQHAPLKPDWLASRTSTRAFKAAGLLESDGSERDTSDFTERPSEYSSRGRSGSLSHNLSGTSTVLAPSPLSGGGGSSSNGVGSISGALGRLGSARGTASEYNPSSHHGRAHSRMAFSEAAGPASSGRRGSGSYSAHDSGNGLMESPTFTASSRDTPRSVVSTAATSISGYGVRESRDRDEIRELRDKHSTEMDALLSALSDTQRTVRMLREENNDLRDRLERVLNLESENDELKHMCTELRRERAQLNRVNDSLRRELSSTTSRQPSEFPAQWNSTSFRTPKQPKSSSNGRHQERYHPLQQEERGSLHVPSDRHTPVFAPDDDDDEGEDAPDPSNEDDLDPPATPHPAPRRGSTASSIFPNPPSNMTMLLHEDPTQSLDKHPSNQSSMEQFRYPNTPARPSSLRGKPMQSPPPSRAVRGRGDHAHGRSHSRTLSISSAHNVSPTTANFSFVTGSPGSLFLKPEHEMFLGDMESLDLGVRLEDADRQLGLVSDGDGW